MKKEEEFAIPLDEWIEQQAFETTDSIAVPDKMADQVIGQEAAVEVIKKAASQKRHVMLIGEPGTGKSMLANAMTEYLPKGDLQDVVAYHNPEDFNEPRIRVLSAGEGKSIVTEQKFQAAIHKNQKNIFLICALIVAVTTGIFYMFRYGDTSILWIAALSSFFIYFMFRMPGQKHEITIIPKLLVGHDPTDMPPFVDATGAHAGALLGDVRHDPFQSGGLETPSHDRLEPGAIHKANKGVLFIDEINMLKQESQQAILTAMQEKELSVTGQSERSSGALVKSEPVPTDFVLVCAGNLDALQGMHPALRSRIRGYGYEVYMKDTMPDTHENRMNIIRFVAQEVKKDGKIPPFNKYAVKEIIRDAQRRSGRKGELTLRFRELGGLVRISGDLAISKKEKIVTADDVIESKKTARSLEQQIADRSVENHKKYDLFSIKGKKVGTINGLAALNTNSSMAEYSGIVLPIVAEVSPSQSKKGGRIIATGKLGEIARESIDNISSIVKKYALRDIADSDIHVQFVGTYSGVEGDSASITVTTAILSALEDIPIDQTMAMTGSLNVRGMVLPVGGITAKLEAAAQAGIKRAIIPRENARDVMIEKRYYDMMEIILVETFRDVVEYAYTDCPKKQEYLDKLCPLNPSGQSTAERLKSQTFAPTKGFRSTSTDITDKGSAMSNLPSSV
ncbi:MAG: ATP-dependent protease LonB [archaeon]|nr:ATP-dependent protease LonB [archaeon]